MSPYWACILKSIPTGRGETHHLRGTSTGFFRAASWENAEDFREKRNCNGSLGRDEDLLPALMTAVSSFLATFNHSLTRIGGPPISLHIQLGHGGAVGHAQKGLLSPSFIFFSNLTKSAYVTDNASSHRGTRSNTTNLLKGLSNRDPPDIRPGTRLSGTRPCGIRELDPFLSRTPVLCG